jgi:hypothetical protein
VQSLQHSVAWEAAKGIVALVAPAGSTDEERRELFNKVYSFIKAALARYEEKADRRMKRLGP